MIIRSSLFTPRPRALPLRQRLRPQLTEATARRLVKSTSHQQRFVGSSEMEPQSSMRSHSSHDGYSRSRVPTNVVGSPASGTVITKIKPPQRQVSLKVIWCVFIALPPTFLNFSICSSTISLILDLRARLQVHHPYKPHQQHPCCALVTGVALSTSYHRLYSLSPNTAHCPTTDDRTKQIAKHVSTCTTPALRQL